MSLSDAPAKTPMMLQHERIKAEHPDAILFFRMGDFYEMFDQDAEVAAPVLGIALTSRTKGPLAQRMCGVPYHAYETYLKRLLQAGHKVAICDQVEDPRLAKGLVQRAVTRIVTPGTLTEESLLNERDPHFIAAVLCAVDGSLGAGKGRRCGVAWLDLSTGGFRLREVPLAELDEFLLGLGAAEILVPDRGALAAGQDDLRTWRRRFPQACITPRPAMHFEGREAERRYARQYGVGSLAGFGLSREAASTAAGGALLAYIDETQRGARLPLRAPELQDESRALLLPPSTCAGLDLFVGAVSRERRDSLLGHLDRTVTAMGARLLREWIAAPLVEVEAIRLRLQAVGELVETPDLAAALRADLRSVQDLERLLTRIAAHRAQPQQLHGLRGSLEALPRIAKALSPHSPLLAQRDPSALLERLGSELRGGMLEDLRDELARALVEPPPPHTREGGFIRDGYRPELDELRQLSRHGEADLERLRAQEAVRLGLPQLKLGQSRVFGPYLEVTRSHKDRVPAQYQVRQDLVGARRFVTPELDALGQRLQSAAARAQSLEVELFVDLLDRAAAQAPRLQELASILAQLDVLLALAQVARRGGYVRPVVDDSLALQIVGGRHPLLEVESEALGDEAFVPNDLVFDERRLWIITGPNMAGKSTYIRQCALIVILAQMGSFVPAQSARIGVVDRLFTRIGASDEILRGRSTFMVEMSEVAQLLHRSSPRSLVVLDEVGRGTSTYDGLSLAWAIVERLVQGSGARALFATHYHQLTALAERDARVGNLHAAVLETGGSIAFLREIRPGASDKSYGLHVARLAGIPAPVLERAAELLRALESGAVAAQPVPAPVPAREIQLDLFPASRHPILDDLAGLVIDRLTPLEALTRLAQWQARLLAEKG